MDVTGIRSNGMDSQPNITNGSTNPHLTIINENIHPRNPEYILFIAQIVIIGIVIVVSVINLSVGIERESLWVSLMSSCLGYILPSPFVFNKKSVDQNQAK